MKQRNLYRLIILIFSMNTWPSICEAKAFHIEKTQDYLLNVNRIAELDGVVWGLVFLDSDTLIATVRSGEVKLINVKSKKVTSVKGGFSVDEFGQGGLLDVKPHPDFTKNSWLYFTFSRKGTKDKRLTTLLGRAQLKGNVLQNKKILLEAVAHNNGGRHFGSRLQFDSSGALFMTVGDRGDRDRAQKLDSHAGKVLRLDDLGRPFKSNPFLKQRGALPEIFSFGHRNPQGISLAPSGQVWIHEHGPRGGDEINLIQAGKNYGWPIITYGREYSGRKVGQGLSEKKGLVQPVKYYVPSIAPSGMIWYSGSVFKKWKNNIFSGALALTHLNRVSMNKGKATGEERLLLKLQSRIRSLAQGPDGLIYVGTDSGDLLQIKPQ